MSYLPIQPGYGSVDVVAGTVASTLGAVGVLTDLTAGTFSIISGGLGVTFDGPPCTSMTINYTGIYKIFYNISWMTGVGSDRWGFQMALNGTPIVGTKTMAYNVSGGNANRMDNAQCTHLLAITAGGVLKMQAYVTHANAVMTIYYGTYGAIRIG